AGIRVAQTLVDQKHQGESVSDLRSPAINAGKPTRYHSSLRREDRYCAAIVSAPIAQRSKEHRHFDLKGLLAHKQPPQQSAAGCWCVLRVIILRSMRLRK